MKIHTPLDAGAKEVRGMNIALVDDDAADRLRLEQLLREYGTIHQLELRLDHFSGGEALLASYTPFRYAVIFLDIFMDGLSGIETAKGIRAVDDDSSIVFLTTSEAFRPDAFSLFATSYLIKPCSREEVFRTLDHIFRLRTAEGGRFAFSYDRREFSLAYGDIVSLETDGNYLAITDKAGQHYRTRMTFSAAMEHLDSRFLVLMKGVAVNMDRIAHIQDGRCRMQDGTVLPLHVKRQEELREQWLNYKFTKIREKAASMEDAT